MKVTVPTDIDAIELGQFQKWSLANTDDADRDFLLFKTIEIFCGMEMRLVSQFPLDTAEEIATEIFAVLDQKKPFQNRFTLDGVEFGFVPDLEAISIGEYIDLENGLKDIKEFHKAAAVMFRPILKSSGPLYTVEGYNPTTETINRAKKFPMGAVSAAIVFFYNIVNELREDFQAYSLKVRTEALLTIQQRLNSAKSGVGINHSTPLQEETLLKLKLQQK